MTATIMRTYSFLSNYCLPHTMYTLSRDQPMNVPLDVASKKRLCWWLCGLLWKPQLVHALNKDDLDRRSQFREWYVHITEKDPSVEDRILWSDEATFHLNGQVNWNNSVYYAEANPHLLMEGKRVQSPDVRVYFLWRYSQRWDVPYDAAWIWPWSYCFYAGWCTTAFRECCSHLPGRNVYKLDRSQGTTDWPARSPNLTPVISPIVLYCKRSWFSRNPDSLQTLRQYVREEIQKIDWNKQLCQNICHVTKDRCLECIGEEGINTLIKCYTTLH